MAEPFTMTPELMDQVIFGMENQKEKMILDSETGLVLPLSSLAEEELQEERYYQLPSWEPADGFQLMEGFAGALQNPIYRERLRQILNAGRGVFRGFKNVLKERPDLEKKWFLYKERYMKQRVKEWYSDLWGYWDALDAGEEPVEMDDLFLEEFSIVRTQSSDERIAQYRDAFFQEIYKDYPENLQALLIRQLNWRNRLPEFVLLSLTPSEMICGILTAFSEESGGDIYLQLDCLYVLPDYRGAGIASGLIDRAAKEASHEGVSRFLIPLPPEGAVMNENLKRKGFSPVSTTLIQDVQKWYYESEGF